MGDRNSSFWLEYQPNTFDSRRNCLARHARTAVVFDLVQQFRRVGTPDVADLATTERWEYEPLEHLPLLVGRAQVLAVAAEIIVNDRFECGRGLRCMFALIVERGAAFGDGAKNAARLFSRVAESRPKGQSAAAPSGAILHDIALLASREDQEPQRGQ